MKISNITLLILAYLATAALGKGGGGGGRGGGGRGGGGRGGGGRGGGSSGGSRGGGSSAGRGSSTASGRYGNSNGGRPAMTQPGAAVGTRAGSYSYPAGSTSYPKGGYGGFAGSPPPYSYANTRTSYTRYPTTYTGGYGGGTRSGWVGGYNPGLIYWSIIPAWAFIGYYGAYHRFNQDDGAYYAPEISAASSGSYAVLNGTENTSDEDNYYYTFNMTTAYSYPMADHGFNPANFAYRLAFAHIVEFNDANQNGFYDDNEAIVSAVSLDNVAWDNISVSNQTSPANASLWYYEFATVGRNLTHTRTQQPFDAYLTWRSTNLQVNMTEGVPLQPNSLQYNLTLANYPALANSTHRLAIAQILTTQDDTSIFQDVNTTTPIDVANQIKTNQTYGMSLGDYSQGRLEYEPTFNITEVTNPPTQAGIPSDANTNSWIWGDQAATRKQHLLFISIPPSNTNGTPNPRLTGFSFLDTNVMNAMAFENLDSASPKLKLSMMMSLVTVFAAYALFL
ncbi:hypothetical protein BDB00DRAFT_860415 [Zychaea mexicana]|uniref:uncharacterized protein n=1 Tax=Zychaea mexicana TaxID=64656 RepID=UPI0022FDB68B|nr:uncharacterized protein BDB00DRAFT_860415 [Zychaea mexicana]KAI9474810.1 hypothetical protein BDB00DRAFT_860415 [Zychaea mexicana]